MRADDRKRKVLAGGNVPPTMVRDPAMTVKRPEPALAAEQEPRPGDDVVARRSQSLMGCSAVAQGSPGTVESVLKRRCMAAKRRARYACLLLVILIAMDNFCCMFVWWTE